MLTQVVDLKAPADGVRIAAIGVPIQKACGRRTYPNLLERQRNGHDFGTSDHHVEDLSSERVCWIRIAFDAIEAYIVDPHGPNAEATEP